MLHDLSAYLVQLCRHRVHFCTNHCAGFIYQVNCLIRQETISDIPIRKGCRSNQRLILNLNTMEYLIPLFQTAENGYGIFHSRLFYQNRLEPPFQCGILFNVLTIFIQRCRANTVEFAPGQHRLQQISGIHCAIRFSGTYNGMEFVYEQNDAAFTFLDFIQDSLQTLLKFAPVLCAGNQCAQIQGKDLSIFQIIRNISSDNSQSKTFCNGSFSDTRFPDQNRIILGLSGKNPDHIPDFRIPADNRIQFSGTCTFYQILSVFCEHIIGFLRILIRYSLIAPYLHQRLQKSLFRHRKRL